eukprot:gene9693-1899_t
MNKTTSEQKNLLKTISPYMPDIYDGFFHGETMHPGVTQYLISELNLETLTKNGGQAIIDFLKDYCEKTEETHQYDYNLSMTLRDKFGSMFQIQGASENSFYVGGQLYEMNMEKLKSIPDEYEKMKAMIESGYLIDARVHITMNQRVIGIMAICTLLADEFMISEKKKKPNILLKKSVSKRWSFLQ